MKTKFFWLFYAALAVVCLASLRSVSAQQPATLAAELAPPVYSTFAQSGGVNWIAYGYLYPLGTFDGLPPCEQPDGITPIGSYRISGEFGNAGFHVATYRLTFGKPNDGKQFVFSGIFSFSLSELGQPETATYAAGRLVRGGLEEGFEAEVTMRNDSCLGARVTVRELLQNSRRSREMKPIAPPADRSNR